MSGEQNSFTTEQLIDPSDQPLQGDSGGPLLVTHDGHATLVGIVSFGYGCGNAAYPGIYTRIFWHVSWIKNEIKKRTEVGFGHRFKIAYI